MEKIFYNLIENQNQFHPKLSSEIRIKGKSNTNSLRPESCPAIYEASSMGFVFFSETEFFFGENCYSVNIYNTKNKKTGKIGKDIVTPALLGSNEKEFGFYKIGNGLNIKLGKSGAFVLPPLDPRLKNKNLDYSIAYLPPFYCGQLIAAVRPLNQNKIVINKGDVIGQLVLLNNTKTLELIQEEFENSIQHYENDFIIINDNVSVVNSNDFDINK